MKEIKSDLDRLNLKIIEVGKTTSTLMGEKARLQSRIDFLSNQYGERKNATLCSCLIC